MGPGSGLALDGGGARAVVLTLGSVLNVKQLLLKSLLLFLLNVKTQKQCFSVNVEQLYARDGTPRSQLLSILFTNTMNNPFERPDL